MNINDINPRKKYILTIGENSIYTKGTLVYIVRVDKSDNTVKVGLAKNKKMDTVWVKPRMLKEAKDYIDPVKAILEKILSPEDFKIVSNTKGFDDLTLDYEGLLGFIADKITSEDIAKLAVETKLEVEQPDCTLERDLSTAERLNIGDIKVGMSVMAVDNTNSHSYPLHENLEVVEVGSSVFIARKANGETGNKLDPADCVFGTCSFATNTLITRKIMSEECREILSHFAGASKLSLDQSYINVAFAEVAQAEDIIKAIDTIKSSKPSED